MLTNVTLNTFPGSFVNYLEVLIRNSLSIDYFYDQSPKEGRHIFSIFLKKVTSLKNTQEYIDSSTVVY